MRWCLPLLAILLLCGLSAVSAGETYVFDGQWGVSAPGDIAVDSHGDVYVSSDSEVERFDGWGHPIAAYNVWGEPHGVAVHGDTVYAGSPGSWGTGDPDGLITLFSSRGALLESWNGTPLAFYYPWGLGTDSAGRLWVADCFNHRVRSFWPNGTASVVLGSGSSDMSFPWDVAVNATGYVHVVASVYAPGIPGGYWVSVYRPNGSVAARWGRNGTAPGELYPPRGSIAVDGSGAVFVADSLNNRVQKFSPDGTLLAVFGGYGETPGVGRGRLRNPFGVTVDAAGTVFVADSGDALVQRFREPLAIPGGAGIPTSSGENGLCDDVNGNGRADFADVVLYFNQMSWIADHEPVAGFDYNGNGRIDFADVVWLFNNL